MYGVWRLQSVRSPIAALVSLRRAALQKLCVFHVSLSRSVRLQDGKAAAQLNSVKSVIVHLLRFSSLTVHYCKVHPCNFHRHCPLLQFQRPRVKVSRPAWSRDHFFGLSLGLDLTVIGLNWSRPRSREVMVSCLIRVGLVVSKRSFAFLIN